MPEVRLTFWDNWWIHAKVCWFLFTHPSLNQLIYCWSNRIHILLLVFLNWLRVLLFCKICWVFLSACDIFVAKVVQAKECWKNIFLIRNTCFLWKIILQHDFWLYFDFFLFFWECPGIFVSWFEAFVRVGCSLILGILIDKFFTFLNDNKFWIKLIV